MSSSYALGTGKKCIRKRHNFFDTFCSREDIRGREKARARARHGYGEGGSMAFRKRIDENPCKIDALQTDAFRQEILRIMEH